MSKKEKKYYAVKKGIKPGVYETWEECKENIRGFSGAEYRSFKTKEEAQAFVDAGTINLEEVNLDELTSYAFVDGSFNIDTRVYGYGGFLMYKKEDDTDFTKVTLKGSGSDEDTAAMQNVAGEILGSQAAIEKAIELELKELTIFYDYMGIEMWAKGLWQCNKKGTLRYQQYCKSVKDKITLNFVKVKGHTGIEGNEEADKLAKEAVGI